MIKIPNKYIKDINSPVRVVKAKVEIYNDSTLLFNLQNNIKEFTISRTGENSKFFGFGYAQKITVKVIDMKREFNILEGQKIKVAYTCNPGVGFVKTNPFFTITKVNRNTDSNELTLEGYDNIYFASQYPISDIPKGYTIYDLAEQIVTKIKLNGLKIERLESTETCFNTNYPTGANFQGNETLRSVLDKIAEATQTIYYVDSDDYLVFKRLSKTAPIDMYLNRATYLRGGSIGETQTLSTIASITELGDNVSSTTSSAGNTQYVRENPFWTLRNDLGTLLDNAITNIGGLQIAPFNLEWRGHFGLEIGDKIGIFEKGSLLQTSFVLDDTIYYNGGLKQTTKWQYDKNSANTETNSSTLGDKLNQTYARVDKANQEIELVAGEVSKIRADVDGISISYDGTKGTASITIGDVTVNNLVDGTYVEDAIAGITVTGYVKFEDLKQSGQTTINGDNITTGTIQGVTVQARVENPYNVSGYGEGVEMSSTDNRLNFYDDESVAVAFLEYYDNGGSSGDGSSTPRGLRIRTKSRNASSSTNDIALRLTADGNIALTGKEIWFFNDGGGVSLTKLKAGGAGGSAVFT